ncbi:hypothetical protein HMPREF3151_07390 [Corynebacterium sp. HMSC05H05]|nr:hypothetical protein HMPREF3151_07390 [Corynebacterium sp. HMSC05H05]
MGKVQLLIKKVFALRSFPYRPDDGVSDGVTPAVVIGQTLDYLPILNRESKRRAVTLDGLASRFTSVGAETCPLFARLLVFDSKGRKRV